VILTGTIASPCRVARCREGVRGDDSNVKAIAVDHAVGCPSGENGVGECERDSKISAGGSEGSATSPSESAHNGEGRAWVSPADRDRDRDMGSANHRMTIGSGESEVSPQDPGVRE
jgi:hypothetical protein